MPPPPDCATIDKLKDVEAVCGTPSVTETVNDIGELVTAKPVPETVPVTASNVNESGNVPTVKEYVYVPNPPLATTGTMLSGIYCVNITGLAGTVTVIAGGALVCTLKANVPVFCCPSVSATTIVNVVVLKLAVGDPLSNPVYES